MPRQYQDGLMGLSDYENAGFELCVVTPEKLVQSHMVVGYLLLAYFWHKFQHLQFQTAGLKVLFLKPL